MTADEKDKTIHILEAELSRLRDENKKLEETIQWMHDLIWKMVKEREALKSESGESKCLPEQN